MSAQIEEKKLCKMVLSKGKRKDSMCNRKLQDDETDFCKFHVDKGSPFEVCMTILTKGERKNQFCLRKVSEEEDIPGKLCKIHAALESKRPTNPFTEKEVNARISGKKVISSIDEFDISRLNPKFHQKSLAVM